MDTKNSSFKEQDTDRRKPIFVLPSRPHKLLGLILGFGSIIFLMLVIEVIGLLGMSTIESHVTSIVKDHMQKISLVDEMHYRARERTLNLHRMMLIADPFERDDEFMRFNHHGAMFARARTDYLRFRLDEDEVTLINEQGRYTGMAVPVQEQVADLVANEDMKQARRVLVEGVIPLQDRVLNELNKLKTYQENAAIEAGKQANLEYRNARNWVMVLSALLGILAIAIAVYVISGFSRSIREREQYLLDLEKTRTELELSSNNLMLAKSQAEMANNAKSQFLANMSHELRTPLNAIIGYSELLKEQSQDMNSNELDQDCDKIQGAAKYLSRIVSEILDLSKIESGKMESRLEYFDLKHLLDEVSVIIAPMANENDNLYIENIEPNLGLFYSDAIKIRQILFNILNNACKFTHNGRVTLFVRREDISGEDWCVVEVEDTGIGIADEHLEHVFQPFGQADSSPTRKYGGTGLGLAIAKNLCEFIHGSIAVRSVEGEGSVFIIKFPVVVKNSETTASAPFSKNIYSLK